MGVGTLFSTDAGLLDGSGKITVVPLEAVGSARYRGLLTGPTGKTLRGSRESSLPLVLQLRDEGSAHLALGSRGLDLQLGTWSPIAEIAFDLGRWVKAHAVTRAILTQVHPHVRLYVMPLQLHPLRSPWRYGSPGSFLNQLWKEHGPFLTLGMPQDTTALEECYITDDQFLALCDSIFETRRRMLMDLLPGFREGLLAAVFDSLDRIQHAFSRDRLDIVERWYVKLDALVGEVAQRLADLGMDGIRLAILSDHGITRFEHKVHLNRWLVEHGYLVEVPQGESNDLSAVDWSRTRAYAVGLNSLYLNVAGREAQGSVGPEQIEGLTRRLQDELQAWRGPDGSPVVQRAWRREETFAGPLAKYGPDMVVGYAPGYRASAETGLGKWKETVVEPNQDRWNSDHCVDHRAVPGVLFANLDLQAYANPSYRDIPDLVIGMEPSQSDVPPAPELGREEMEAIEDRLKGLGYL
jgi:hypothetical protein